MQSSMFNLRVPLDGRSDVFLMNTLTDAQIVVSPDVAALLDRFGSGEAGKGNASLSEEEREAVGVLEENGFLVESREWERGALDRYFARVTGDATELHVTVLTTLQCNFACDYCYQGDHGDYNKFAEKMTSETATRVGDWIERELDRVQPERMVLMFFGGEPLLNIPVLYALSERMAAATRRRGVAFTISMITNGLLLTEDIVDHLVPFGLSSVKVTLDGDRESHNRMRPLRGGQGTFDRIIENIGAVADRVRISIGGNFDESSVDTYPALLDFLKAQDFADKLGGVHFKPIVREGSTAGIPLTGRGGSAATNGRQILPLIPVTASGAPMKPLAGTCMTSAGAGNGSTCDSCDFAAEKMAFLHHEIRNRGFNTPDGVHNGPCHVHMKHAHTIGPDGSLYACPGFTGEKALSTGHIDDRREPWRDAAREKFDYLAPWKSCGDCAFIPVCAGGCVAASQAQLGDMNAPTCHKQTFESALIALAHDVAGAV
jgi:uncharacterized protein